MYTKVFLATHVFVELLSYFALAEWPQCWHDRPARLSAPVYQDSVDRRAAESAGQSFPGYTRSLAQENVWMT